MLAIVALSFAVARFPQSPEPPELPPVILFAAFDVPTGHVATSRDDATAAIVSAATAHRIDARKRTSEALPEAGNVASVALGGSGTEYALGLRDGRIVHVAADGTRREFLVDAGRSILGLTWHPRALAWWTSSSLGGVLDLRSGRQLLDPALEVAVHLQWPAIELTADGRHACWRARSNDLRASAYAVIQKLETGAEVARLPVYETRRSALCVVGDHVVHANRADARTWHLAAFDTTNGTTRRLDAGLRGGHFVDLAASPIGRFVVEGDFEEVGITRYRLDRVDPERTTFGSARGFLGCGLLRHERECVEVAFLSPERDDQELLALRLEDGRPIGVPMPKLGARRPERAGSLMAGTVLWTVLGTHSGRRIEFFALP